MATVQDGDGYILLWRRFFDNPLWTKKREFSEAEAWIDILAKTAYSDYTQMVGITPVELKRGEFLGAVRGLAKRWGWSKSRVQRFLDRIQDLKMICKKTGTPQGDIYIVVNYEAYQNPWDTSAGHERDTSGTPAGHLRKKEKKEIINTSNESPEVRVVFDYWVQKTGRTPNTRLTPERRNKIKARLKTFSVDELKQAINGVMASSFHASNPSYTDLVSCFGNDSKVEAHIQRASEIKSASNSLNRPLSIQEARAMYG